MRTLIIFLLLTGTVYAKCIGQINNIIQDPQTGNIKVVAHFTLNSQNLGVTNLAVAVGNDSDEEIIAKINKVVDDECERLIEEIPANASFHSQAVVNIEKDRSQATINRIKPGLLLQENHIEKSVIKYQGKEIEIRADGNNIIRNP